MKITFTKNAIEELNRKIGDQEGILKIKYETEAPGLCGCSGGLPTLWFVSKADPEKEIILETNDRPVVVDQSELEELDEEKIKIHFSQATASFQLITPQQILNGSCILENKIKA